MLLPLMVMAMEREFLDFLLWLLSLLAAFHSDRTLEMVFIMLSLRVKVLGFHKEGKFKEEE